LIDILNKLIIPTHDKYIPVGNEIVNDKVICKKNSVIKNNDKKSQINFEVLVALFYKFDKLKM